MLDEQSASRLDISVDGAAPQPELGKGSDTGNDRSSRAIKGVLLALKAGPLFILALMILFLWAATEGHVFLTLGNIGNVLEQSGGVCIIALGQLLVILTRGIDLSIGSNVSLCCVMVTVVYRDTGSTWLAIGVTLLTGFSVGLVNGLLLVWGRLPHPFIATLATLSICAGLALYIAGGSTVLGSPSIVHKLGGGRIPGIPGAGHIGWFPYATLVVIVFTVICAVILHKLVWGRWIYAVGGSPEAAVRTGVPMNATLISVYVMSGLSGAIGGHALRRDRERWLAVHRTGHGAQRHCCGHHRRRELPGRPWRRPERPDRCVDPRGHAQRPQPARSRPQLPVHRRRSRRRRRGRARRPAGLRREPVPQHAGETRMTDAVHTAAPSDVEPVLSVRGATKTFGAVVALDGVDLEVRSGEVLALLGDNGAGKSTLIKCISGVHKLDRGEIRIDGAPVQITSPADARSHGIETVYQDLALFDNLNPTANFFAGREVAGPSWLPRGLQWMKQKEMSTRTKDLLDRLQIRLPDFDADVALMSGGQRQAVAVARAVAFSSKLVILDEPTAALGLRESARVLELVDRLRTSGVAVILISHSMDHVMAVADRAMVMRRGRKIGEAPATADNQEQLVSWIVGARGSTTV